MIDLRPEVTIVYVFERYVLHIFEATAIYLIAVAAFYWMMRKLGWRRMQGWWALIAPAVLAFIPISFREVFDVYNGDPIYKSFTDWSSWMVGFGLAIWGIYRLTPLFYEILIEIKFGEVRREAVFLEAAEDVEKGDLVEYTSNGKIKPVEPWPDPPPKPEMPSNLKTNGYKVVEEDDD